MNIRHLLVCLLLLLGFSSAHAAITCTISSPGFAMAYTAGLTANQQTYFDVRCTRGALTDPVSVSFDVGVNNGLYNAGQNNQARTFVGGVAYNIRYEHFTNACGTIWKNNKIAATLTFSGTSDMSPVTRQLPFWGCVNVAQTGMPSGTYSDQVTFTLTHTATSTTIATTTGTTAVTIYAPANCTLSTLINPVAFTYVAFGGAQTASTTFGATCTNTLPYTMTLNAATGTIAGLVYTLTVPASATGTGFLQTHTISGNMVAGQAGTCTTAVCSGTVPHSITIAY